MKESAWPERNLSAALLEKRADLADQQGHGRVQISSAMAREIAKQLRLRPFKVIRARGSALRGGAISSTTAPEPHPGSKSTSDSLTTGPSVA